MCVCEPYLIRLVWLRVELYTCSSCWLWNLKKKKIVLHLYIYIYILVIGNIMNMYLFMQVEIARYLLSFGKTTIVLFIYIRFIALHLKVIFYSNYYKYII